MDKKNVIIIHGAYGNPDENWFPWLKKEIEYLGVKVFVPIFPTPEGQSLQAWNDVFRVYEKVITPNTILVGHSLGPAFILNLLERIDISISSSHFVAPFTGLLNNIDFDSINFSITDREFDWELIKKHCDEFYIYHSDNDPYVPQCKSELIARKLNAKKYELIRGAGHFNMSAGFSKFPLLFEDIKTKLLS